MLNPEPVPAELSTVVTSDLRLDGKPLEFHPDVLPGWIKWTVGNELYRTGKPAHWHCSKCHGQEGDLVNGTMFCVKCGPGPLMVYCTPLNCPSS